MLGHMLIYTSQMGHNRKHMYYLELMEKIEISG